MLRSIDSMTVPDHGGPVYIPTVPSQHKALLQDTDQVTVTCNIALLQNTDQVTVLPNDTVAKHGLSSCHFANRTGVCLLQHMVVGAPLC